MSRGGWKLDEQAILAGIEDVLKKYSKAQVNAAINAYATYVAAARIVYEQHSARYRQIAASITPASRARISASLNAEAAALQQLETTEFSLQNDQSKYLGNPLAWAAAAAATPEIPILSATTIAILVVIAGAGIWYLYTSSQSAMENSRAAFLQAEANVTNAQTTASAKDTIQDMCSKGLLPPQQCAAALSRVSQNATDQTRNQVPQGQGSSSTATTVILGGLFVAALVWVMFED